MPTTNDLIKRRIKEAEQSAGVLDGLVRGLQSAMYALLIEWITGKIETEDNKIKFSAGNLGKVAGIYSLFARFQRTHQDTLLSAVLDRAGRLFGLNNEYFSTIKTVPESVEQAAVRLTLQRWGYNATTKELIPGGYFEALFSNRETARKVASVVNRAIGAKMTLPEFQKQFRAVFVGKPGQGMMERYWQTNSYDLFQRIDRAANLVYADRLGLKYAIYSGTVKDNTRPFCEARVNKVFSRTEIDNWKNLTWAGKIEVGYDPYLDCGGYRCRHHLSFIGNEIAAHLRPELN